VTFIKSEDKTTYLACPDCKKKVIEEPGQGARCDNCRKSFEAGVPTYMLLAKVADGSGELFVNFYRNNAEPIMGGLTAEEFEKLRSKHQTEPEAFV
jgi:hypothetical protein